MMRSDSDTALMLNCSARVGKAGGQDCIVTSQYAFAGSVVVIQSHIEHVLVVAVHPGCPDGVVAQSSEHEASQEQQRCCLQGSNHPARHSHTSLTDFQKTSTAPFHSTTRRRGPVASWRPLQPAASCAKRCPVEQRGCLILYFIIFCGAYEACTMQANGKGLENY